MIHSLYISFTRYKIGEFDPAFTLRNYERILGDSLFWNGFTVLLMIGAIQLPITVLMSLALAAIIYHGIRGGKIFNIGYFTPTVSSLVVAATIWAAILNPAYGILNHLLRAAGLPPQDWLGRLIQISLMNVINWRWFGWYVVIVFAGMSAIPIDLYESAKIDGSGRIKTFRRITLPLLQPTLMYIIFVSIISVVNLFAEPYIMLGGSTFSSQTARSRLIYTPVMYLYDVAFRYFNFGYSAALSWIVFIIGFLSSFLVLRKSAFMRI